MTTKKIKLLMVDQKMRTAEIEIEPWLYRQLNISADIVKSHKTKSALNKCLTDFLQQ